jgi:disulfide bond formation protein DsbB
MHSKSSLRRFVAGLGITIVAITAGACGGGAPDPEQVAAGQAAFRKTCATCHGPDAEGMPRLGKKLHDNAFVRGRSDSELVQFIKQGRPANHPDNERKVDMPPKGGNPALTEEQMQLIVAYLRSIQ